MNEQTQPEQKKPTAWQSFRKVWVTEDNLTLLMGLLFTSVGAGMWSVRAGVLTCGCVLLGVIAVRLVLESLGGKR